VEDSKGFKQEDNKTFPFLSDKQGKHLEISNLVGEESCKEDTLEFMEYYVKVI